MFCTCLMLGNFSGEKPFFTAKFESMRATLLSPASLRSSAAQLAKTRAPSIPYLYHPSHESGTLADDRATETEPGQEVADGVLFHLASVTALGRSRSAFQADDVFDLRCHEAE